MNALYCYLKNSEFGGKNIKSYELYVLECFKNKFIEIVIQKEQNT